MALRSGLRPHTRSRALRGRFDRPLRMGDYERRSALGIRSVRHALVRSLRSGLRPHTRFRALRGGFDPPLRMDDHGYRSSRRSRFDRPLRMGDYERRSPPQI